MLGTRKVGEITGDGWGLHVRGGVDGVGGRVHGAGDAVPVPAPGVERDDPVSSGKLSVEGPEKLAGPREDM